MAVVVVHFALFCENIENRPIKEVSNPVMYGVRYFVVDEDKSAC